MTLRLDPDDDLLHPLEAAPMFNESRYYNFFDAAAGLGGWVRMRNRLNEGYAELTVCLYLPDGRVLVLTDPRVMLGPRQAFADTRRVPCSIDDDAERFHRTPRVRARAADHTYDVEATVWSNIPLRDRRESPDGEIRTTRIAEGMTTWCCDGVVGSGLAEHLDQIDDGVRVGTLAGH